MIKFIKLTKIDGKSLNLNPNYIQSIEEIDLVTSNKSCIQITMGFDSSTTYKVIETEAEILKMIQKLSSYLNSNDNNNIHFRGY
jgi:uncharacterized protein YlzI (FlbEa/FlbD family)